MPMSFSGIGGGLAVAGSLGTLWPFFLDCHCRGLLPMGYSEVVVGKDDDENDTNEKQDPARAVQSRGRNIVPAAGTRDEDGLFIHLWNRFSERQLAEEEREEDRRNAEAP